MSDLEPRRDVLLAHLTLYTRSIKPVGRTLSPTCDSIDFRYAALSPSSPTITDSIDSQVCKAIIAGTLAALLSRSLSLTAKFEHTNPAGWYQNQTCASVRCASLNTTTRPATS